MEVVGRVAVDDGVSSVWFRGLKYALCAEDGELTVTTGSTTAERRLLRQHVRDLPLSCSAINIYLASPDQAGLVRITHLHRPTGYQGQL